MSESDVYYYRAVSQMMQHARDARPRHRRDRGLPFVINESREVSV